MEGSFLFDKYPKEPGFLYKTIAPKNRPEEMEIVNMALTRKLLKALGIEDDKIEQIIEAHTSTVDGLTEERDRYKKDAEALPGVRADLKKAQDDLATANADGGWKAKHDSVKKEFDDYKADQKSKETKAAKTTAYRDLVKAAGIGEKYIDKVLKLCDVDAAELEDGKIKGADAITESIKKEFDVFVTVETTKGADTSNPQTGGSGGDDDYTKYESMSMEDYIKSRTPNT